MKSKTARTSILMLAALGASCGSAPELATDSDEIQPAVESPLLVPDLEGAFHLVTTRSIASGSNRILWRSTVNQIPYEILAESGGGRTRIVVSRAGQQQVTMLLDPIFDTIEAVVEGGSLGATYSVGDLPAQAGLPTAADVPGLAAYVETVLPGADGISVGLVLYSFPLLLHDLLEDAPESSASFLGGLLGFLKKVGEFVVGLFGGGGGGGNDCLGGSSASCTNSAGQRTSVNCGDCSARCTEIFGVAGTTCDCGCGI